METLLLPLMNLAILVSILVYFIRKPLGSYVKTRHEVLRQSLDEVRKKLRDAQIKFDEFSSKLKAVEVEETAIREQSVREARDSAQKILQFANDRSKTIVSDAKQAMTNLADDLRTQIRTEFVSKTIVRSEELIHQKLTGDDRARFIREFSQEIS